MNCPHDITEIDVASSADGLCPLCLASDVHRLLLVLEECEIYLSGKNGKSLKYQDTLKSTRDELKRHGIET